VKLVSLQERSDVCREGAQVQEAEFDELLEELRKDADQATWFIGFLKAVVDNDQIPARLNNSLSGFAGVTARAGVKNSVILYCARAWDQDNDAISLRRAVENLPSLEDLDARRRRHIEDISPEIPVTSLAKRYAAFKRKYEAVRNKPYHPSIRLLRTEHFAHRLLKSRERKKLEGEDFVILGATYNELIELAEETVSLVGQLGYLWDRVADPYPDRLERATRYSREFWRLMPVLKDVENLDH
jgi:hypothetical protein